MKESVGGWLIAVDVCVAVSLAVSVTEGIGVLSGVLVSIRVSAGAGVASMIGVTEGSGVGGSVFITETVGVVSWRVVSERKGEDDPATEFLALDELIAKAEEAPSFCVCDTEAATAVPTLGMSAFSNITAANNTRCRMFIVSFDVSMMSPTDSREDER